MKQATTRIQKTSLCGFAPLLLAAALLAAPAAARAQFMEVIDTNTVDQVTPTGTVTVLATLPAASPVGIVFDANGNAYVTEQTDQIVKITPGGTVSTFATLPGGTGARGIVFDKFGNCYTSDTGSSQITKISASGVVSTFATLPSRGYGLAIDASGNLYTSYYDASGTISKISPTGQITTFASIGGGTGPYGLTFDISGNLYTADQNTDSISRINALGAISTFATLPQSTGPLGLAFDKNGNLYTSTVSGKVLEISPNGSTVTTFVSGLSNPALLAVLVPEPGTWAFLVVGALLLAVLRRGVRS